MRVYVNIFGHTFPSYGLLIGFGLIMANGIAIIIAKKKKHAIEDLLIIEAYLALGGFIGAKVLYILTMFNYIKWNQFFNITYFNQIMSGGFVFYGGLLGGLLALYCVWKIHKIPVYEYINHYVFMIPFVHSFGRIGCFCAGCCYGIPYHKFGSVIFPKGSFAIPGIPLFPVQLLEASFLMILAIVLIVIQRKNKLEIYLLCYSVLRFFMEFLRYDSYRGKIFMFSLSQWISLMIIVILLIRRILSKIKDTA